jgi:hypothetical protein
MSKDVQSLGDVQSERCVCSRSQFVQVPNGSVEEDTAFKGVVEGTITTAASGVVLGVAAGVSIR